MRKNEVILISTIYKGSASIQAIKLFEPSKVYFIVDSQEDPIRKQGVIMVKELFPKIIFEEVPTKMYDIVDIARKSMEVIQREKKNKIIVHISEGRKTMGLGLLFGSYVLRDLVDSAYYIIEETNAPLKLPLIELSASPKKKQILLKMATNKPKITKLSKKLNITSSTLYVHLKELRDEGLLTKENTITEMGKIVLLNQKE